MKDHEVNEDERPPETKELADVKIGLIDRDGVKADDIIAPPVHDGKGIIEVPGRSENEDNHIFRKVEIESAYPGGKSAWMRFLLKTIRYPQEASDNRIAGTVVVEFIVDRDGTVSAVQAISGPEELRDEAVRVIMKSGKWTAAIQNGRFVRSYKKQPITFMLVDE